MTADPVGPADHGSPRRGRGRPPTITRQQVIAAAARIGLDNLTIQAVADELAVSRATIYHYVGGTDDLVRMAALESLGPFEDLVEIDGGTWQDWVRGFATACRRWRIEQADVLRIVSLDMTDLRWFLGIVDRGIDILVQGGFSELLAGQALHFIGGVVWINTLDEINARAAPEGRHPQARAMTETVDRSDLSLRHIRRREIERFAFTHFDERFEREISWAIDALELQLVAGSNRDR